jgi:Amt family ammonium transporter
MLVQNENINCINSGDTSWVLVSFILILGMMPALAFFEAGLLRSKNSLSLITQIIGGLVVLSFLWDIFGFSLVFGSSLGGFIGNFDYIFLFGVDYTSCLKHAPTIPGATFALFMMMFACITPLLMTGSYAERVKWRSFLPLTVLWEIFVFYPVAHWIKYFSGVVDGWND